MGNNFGDYIGNGLQPAMSPADMRRQREFAARSRGEKLDEITDIIAGAIMSSKNPVSSPGRRVEPDSESERLAMFVRRAIEQAGYQIVPK